MATNFNVNNVHKLKSRVKPKVKSERPYLDEQGRQLGCIKTSKRTGKDYIALNPYGRVQKAFAELSCGYRMYNDGTIRKDANGRKVKLTKKQIDWRRGYTSHSSDEADLFKFMKGGER